MSSREVRGVMGVAHSAPRRRRPFSLSGLSGWMRTSLSDRSHPYSRRVPVTRSRLTVGCRTGGRCAADQPRCPPNLRACRAVCSSPARGYQDPPDPAGVESPTSSALRLSPPRHASGRSPHRGACGMWSRRRRPQAGDLGSTSPSDQRVGPLPKRCDAAGCPAGPAGLRSTRHNHWWPLQISDRHRGGAGHRDASSHGDGATEGPADRAFPPAQPDHPQKGAAVESDRWGLVGLFSLMRGTPLRGSVDSAVALTVAAVPEVCHWWRRWPNCRRPGGDQ